MEYAKAAVQLLAAILAAVIPGLTDGTPMGWPEWTNVGVLAAGAIMVYNSANIPGYRWAKLVASIVSAIGVMVVSGLSDGALSTSEVIQIITALVGAGLVGGVRNGGNAVDGVFVAGPNAVTRV